MAGQVKMDMEAREIKVNRKRLIEKLWENKIKHMADYEEAVAGYVEIVQTKIKEGYAKALKSANAQYEAALKKAAEFDPEDTDSATDLFRVIDSVTIQQTVPKNYAFMYDKAIDRAEWETEDTILLTYAEFECFVRDQWDWRATFDRVTMLYKSSSK